MPLMTVLMAGIGWPLPAEWDRRNSRTAIVCSQRCQARPAPGRQAAAQAWCLWGADHLESFSARSAMNVPRHAERFRRLYVLGLEAALL